MDVRLQTNSRTEYHLNAFDLKWHALINASYEPKS
jgi:hypothetical protein